MSSYHGHHMTLLRGFSLSMLQLKKQRLGEAERFSVRREGEWDDRDRQRGTSYPEGQEALGK